MFEKIEIFQKAFGLARHAAARQEIVARNIANADTPGYRAQDLGSFDETFRQDRAGPALKTTRPGHMASTAAPHAFARPEYTGDQVSPNGNSVSLETEMVRAVEIREQHERALSIYSTSLNILRTSLGRR